VGKRRENEEAERDREGKEEMNEEGEREVFFFLRPGVGIRSHQYSAIFLLLAHFATPTGLPHTHTHSTTAKGTAAARDILPSLPQIIIWTCF
jgi:hypothetical protein